MYRPADGVARREVRHVYVTVVLYYQVVRVIYSTTSYHAIDRLCVIRVCVRIFCLELDY